MQHNYYFFINNFSNQTQKIIKNVNDVHKNNQVTQNIIVEKKSGHFIRQKDIVQMGHIGRVDYNLILIHIINIEMNQLIIVVTFLVLYQQYPQNMYQTLQIFFTQISSSKHIYL